MICLTSVSIDLHAKTTDQAPENITEKKQSTHKLRRIKRVIIRGNRFTSSDAIAAYITYKPGELFRPEKTRQVIHNLYYGLRRFRTISIKGKDNDDNTIDLYIIVTEKQPLKDIIFQGNSKVSNKEIQKKVNLDLPAVDAEELKAIAQEVKQLYSEKGYHNVTIDYTFTTDADGYCVATFIVKEGKKSCIKRILFEGNAFFSDKELRKVMFSREDWLLSFLDKSGIYQPERIEGDKHVIEQMYQNHGFIQAKVVNVRAEPDADNQSSLTLIYEIEENNRYMVSSVQAPGNEVLPEDILLQCIPIKAGDYYSREAVGGTIKLLERLWGDYGHIFASIDPSIQPDEDNKTVSITFFSDIGNKIYLNRLNIKGNKKTRDKVIRRKILLEEGELLTQTCMDFSKNNVEALGYFEQRDGVNWKIKRVDEDNANLDLIVKEAKTGSFNVQLGFGGDAFRLESPVSGLNFKGQVSDRNLFGSGINWNLEGSLAKEEQTILLHVAQPYLFDKPITGAFDVYHRRPTFDFFSNLQSINAVNQKLTGGTVSLGVITRSDVPLFNDWAVLGSFGIDSIRYQQHPIASNNLPPAAASSYQYILDREFQDGDFVWFAQSFEQDHRNHPMHTSRGHRLKFISKVGFPVIKGNIGFYKAQLEGSWFTPLIGEHDLVFRIRGFLGFAIPIRGHTIPYNELFNIGGDASVRGFLFGQISPRFNNDPIAGGKALWFNAELIFPITPDLTMKGLVFYDGGAGWSNPYAHQSQATKTGFVTNNGFNYRHAVGVGVRLLNPMPMRIDWGFKLDPFLNRQDPTKNESPYEIHFGMQYDW